MSEMSISMCENDGVPSVMTMCRARAASATRSLQVIASFAQARARASAAPGSSKGMRASRTALRRPASFSMPIVRRPRSANDSASGRPTRPQPITATSNSKSMADLEDRGSPTRAGGTVSDVALAPVAHPLPREAADEARVVAQVAVPEPARLRAEAEGPRQPRLLHPARRLGDQAGVEVEGGADAHEDRRLQAPAHRGHPLLLLGDADADPDDVCARAVDLGHDGVLLDLRQR